VEFNTGSRIGDYEIVDVLGVGGMGKVYKVRNVLSDRVEAMKVLLPNLAANPELADRFMREIKVQASLDHPNIAQLHTALHIDNQLLMFMEFVDGVSLEHKLKTEGPLPVPQAVAAMQQVLAALEFAHERGIVHRDIKPANIMITRSGMVKLMDFGIAKGGADNHLTATGSTLGSLYYMSPEQIQGAQNLDSRADLYSAGVTLYELVTGKRPFDGDSQYAIMAAHLEKAPVPPIQIDPALPQMLNDIILLAVAKDRNARFQGAGAMRTALGNVLPQGAVPAFTPAPAATPVPGYSQPPQRMPTSPGFAAPAFAPPPPVSAGVPLAANSAQSMMPPPPPQRSSSNRGLWMALGALAAAACVGGAVYFAPWKALTASKTQESTPLSLENPTRSASATPAQSAASQSTPAQPPATSETAAASQPAASPGSSTPSATPVAAPTQVAANHAPPRHGTAPSPAPQPVQQIPPQPVQQPQPQPQQQAAPTPVTPAPTPAGPSRAEVLEFREHLSKLGIRANGIQSSLGSLERSQQSMGMNLSSKFTGPRDLMNSYMQAAQEALGANDLAAAKDYATKAERQIEILEKLLNR
jgi:serine/threonine-protein kinase